MSRESTYIGCGQSDQPGFIASYADAEGSKTYVVPGENSDQVESVALERITPRQSEMKDGSLNIGGKKIIFIVGTQEGVPASPVSPVAQPSNNIGTSDVVVEMSKESLSNNYLRKFVIATIVAFALFMILKKGDFANNATNAYVSDNLSAGLISGGVGVALFGLWNYPQIKRGFQYANQWYKNRQKKKEEQRVVDSRARYSIIPTYQDTSGSSFYGPISSSSDLPISNVK